MQFEESFPSKSGSGVLDKVFLGMRTDNLGDYRETVPLDGTRRALERRLIFDYIEFRRRISGSNLILIAVSFLISLQVLDWQWACSIFMIYLASEMVIFYFAGDYLIDIQSSHLRLRKWRIVKYYIALSQLTLNNIVMLWLSKRLDNPEIYILAAVWVTLLLNSSSMTYWNRRLSIIVIALQCALMIIVGYQVAERFGVDVNLNVHAFFLLPVVITFAAATAFAWAYRHFYMASLARESDATITQQKNIALKKELDSEHKFLQLMMNSLREAIVTTDQNHDIIEANTAFLDYFGLKRGDALGNMNSYLTDVDLFKTDAKPREFVSKCDRHFLISGSPVSLGDNTKMHLYVLMDITEKVINDAAMFQSQKLNALGKLSSGIAHDFNNFLAIIIANTELIELSDNIEDVKENFLPDIMVAAQNANGLAKQILSYSRKTPLRADVVRVDDVKDHMERLLQNSLEPKFSTTFTLEEGLFVKADQILLENALLNLVFNARDSMKDGGEIKIQILNQQDMVEFSVIDTGIGIESELIEKVKEPFISFKEHDQGTGIGLAMVETFASRLRGRLELTSEVGVGTKASIFLPRCDGGQKNAA